MPQKQLIKEFRKTVFEEYGRTITYEEAETLLRDLTEFFLTLAQVCRRIDRDL